ncbi:LVIVD repeat-containing protein [Carboxylicivirga linearis]|uniref:LVIVD repeat-containing protein n=1 Tax=Carboxylicivirga linearis TaxID=1628157 RepID=A0ABS5JP21_9BACT|nr:hypothetical protein [Carboxylicivirga linearis]MBS2096652.1 hypothetical protein [Carboxylicivirga linearis]
MKKNNFYLNIILLVLLISGCQDKTYEEYWVNEPVYLSYDDLRSSIQETDEQPLVLPGKIYFKDNYLFINELMKGVHVYDNTNPETPAYKTFIKIPGNVDIAIKGDLLYADSYIDLVAINISSIDQPKEKHRIKNVFNYTVPETQNNYRIGNIDYSKGVVLDWNVKEVKEEVVEDDYPIYYDVVYSADYALINSASRGVTAQSTNTAGIAGSTARFMLYNNFLYTINQGWYIAIYDITTPELPLAQNGFYPNNTAETLFIKDDLLFIGGQSGMQIFSLNNPAEPQYISGYSHITACDPVVVNDDYAFVTLRSNNFCGGNTNQLDVINIQNIESPQLRNSLALTNPHGLGVDRDFLFICDGDEGLRVFDATEPEQMGLSNQLKQFNDIHAVDVIPLGDVLLTIGNDGFYQYDYTNINDMKLLSHIEVTASED